MNKFRSLHQWGKEKMGSEGKSGASDDLKALETEMNMRHQGMEKMHASMSGYVKALNKRSEAEGREKTTPIAYLGTAMNRHGEDFEDGNTFGACLMGLGQANERIARFQDTYASHATATWLEALERSLAQMKEYQNARKKLETRRQAYDASLGRMQKAKSGDFKAEDELRLQKIKYEESAEDVQRRMQDIVEAEPENEQQLYAFLEAELNYHDRCREVLLQARRNWPNPTDQNPPTKPPRPRGNTNSTALSRVSTANSNISDDEDLAPPLAPFRDGRQTASGSSTPLHGSPRREVPGFDFSLRPTTSRQNTAEQNPRARLGSIDPAALRSAAALRPTKTRQFSASTATDRDVFNDPGEDDYDSTAMTRSSSPATSISQGGMSRSTSYSTLDSMNQGQGQKKKAPPPPPPSRGSKPPPPPPPMKRSALSSSVVPTM